MPRSAAQSDFVVHASPREDDVVPAAAIGDATDPIELPRAVARTPFASAAATRFVMVFTFIVLSALVLLTLIGPHVPSGE